MKPYDGDKSQCPCCKECIDCNTGFQKVVDLKNAGLVIYRHTTRTEDLNKDTGLIEFATKTTEDVFILHNTKNMDITSADYLPEIAQNKMTCPRCRKIIEHAQKLLKKVPTINKNDIKGICEHCRTRDAPCFECEEVVKKFVANRAESSENKKEKVKQWLSKIKYLLKDAVVDNEKKEGKGRARAHSELSIDQLCRDVPETGRKLEVKQMFHPDSKDFIGAFPPTIEKRKKMFAHFPQLEKVEQPVVFIDQPGTRRPSTFRPTARLQDRDKMYGSDVDSEDLRAMFHPPLTEDEKQERAKKTQLTENIPPVPFQSEEDFKSVRDSTTSFERIIRPKSHQKTNEEIETDKKRFIQLGKVPHRSEVPQQIGTSHDVKQQVWPTKSQKAELENKRSLSSIKSTKRLHGKTGESDKIRKYHSEEALLTTIVGVTEEMIKQDFSYVFPKMLSPDKKKLKRQKSSSELIKDTQDMLQAKAEEEMKRLEVEQKKKLEEEERKRLAREEKKKLLEAKKKADDEKKRLEALEKKSQQKVEQPKIEPDKKDTVKKEKVTPTVSTATTKSKTKDSEKESKPKEPKEPPKPKEPKEPKEPKVPKESKEPKVPKEPKEPKVDKNALKADKEAEKAKKEQEKKEKEERLKKEKEEKERLKKEKEDQLRKEKEMKAKEKDSNSRDKDKDDKLKKEKEAAAAKQKELDRARQEKLDAEKREREEAKNRLRSAKEDEAAVKPEPEKPKVAKKVEEPTTKELKVKSVKVHRPSSDDLILQLVKLKQSAGNRVKPRRLADLNLTSKDVKNHKFYHRQRANDDCIMCTDSDIELDAESLDAFKEGDKMAEIIIGAKLFKYKPPLIDKHKEQNVPILFQSTFDDTKHVAEANESAISPHAEQKRSPVIQPGKQAQKTEQEVAKGVIRYALSDRTFIEKGWTMLPTEKVVRKMNVYRMRPAHPEFDWFEHHKNKRQMQYDTGEKLAEFDDNGRGRWFYRNGRMALDYYDAEELNAQQRFVIFSSGEPDERGRSQPYTLLATFDYLGNGIVFDHSGKIRLKYNQTEGVVLDRNIGPVSHWKWHTLNDPPVLQQVMIDTQMAHKDLGILKLGGPNDGKARPDNEDMLAIEFDNFIKEKSKKLSQSFKPFQIKMKALKINKYFSLKVLDQATVYLIYRDGTTSLKLNIGMVLDHKEIVDTDTANVGEVSNNMERLPARTDSLAGLQKTIAHSQHYERSRTERELRIRPTVSCGSADRLVSAASRPLRPPLRTGLPGCATDSYCKCSRKPSANNLYYDTRLC